MDIKLVIKALQLSDEEWEEHLGLINKLRALTDTEQAQLFSALEPQKKAGKKSAGGGGGRSSRGQSIKNQLSNRRQGQQGVSIDDNEDDGRCTYKIGKDAGGPIICDTTIDNNVHHKQTDPDYHEFTTGKSDA